MASGKKNYYRHSFFARNDIKMKLLREQLGVGFYFYYFSLLEQCGEDSADDLKEFYSLHSSTIRSLWGVNLKKCEHVASVMHAVGLLEFKKVESTFYFTIPNFAKYLGKYETKFPSKFAIKEKESKVNESKAKESGTAFKMDEVIESWNAVAISSGFQSCPLALGGPVLSACLAIKPILDANKLSWLEYFNLLACSEFLKTKTIGGPVTITWAIAEANFYKVITGNFSDKTKTDDDIKAEFNKLMGL